MENFLRYFYQDIGRVFRAFGEIIMAFFNFLNYLLNFPMRMKINQAYDDSFGTKEWILLLLCQILLIAIIVAILWGLVKLFRKIFRFRVSVKKYDELVKQVQNLQRIFVNA